MQKPIKKVLIVGGGTAGWLAATYLQKALKNIEVILIESPNVPKIGVGEATVSTLKFTMNFLGFKDREWMPACSATFKTAIRFEQWNQPKEQGLEYFYHPFFPRHEEYYSSLKKWFPEIGEGISLNQLWHLKWLNDKNSSFAYSTFPGPRLCDSNRGPAFLNEDNYQIPVAYHIDATALSHFLSQIGVKRGIKHIQGHVDFPVLNEKGYITSLKLSDGRIIDADFFIDCTGFRSLLLGKALNSSFTSDQKHLLCNSAVVTRPQNKKVLKNYTSATALSSGWMWETPLFHRAGVGYVYSDNYLSQEQASNEMISFLDKQYKNEDINLIKFQPGHREKSWIKNCVGIGLSSSFIEPLESTTIFLIEYALANLITSWPDLDFEQSKINRFNNKMLSMYKEIRDFIILHYIGSNRKDTRFWQDLKSNTVIPDSLKEKLEFYKENTPLDERFQNFVFRERSYMCLLDGLKLLPQKQYPLLSHVSTNNIDNIFEEINKKTKTLVKTLPSHKDYLENMYKGNF